MNGLAEVPVQATQTQSAPPASTGFKLKCIWLFLLGAVLAVIGLLCIMYRPELGANSFIIMLMGLFFTAAGSIYGKRKLRGDIAVAIPTGQQPMQAQFMQQLQELGIPMQQFIQGMQPQAQPAQQVTSIPVQPQPVQPQPVVKPAAEAKPAAPPAGKEIMKIFVCTSCGAENEMDDKYCYRCGFNLEQVRAKARKTKVARRKVKARPRPAKAKQAAMPKAAVPKATKPEAKKPAGKAKASKAKITYEGA
jgi:ribosomal protein L40E